MQFRRQRVQKYQPAARENSRHEFCKRSAKSFLGTITFGNPPRDILGSRSLQHGTRTGRNFAHRFTQRNFANATAFGAGVAQLKTFEGAASTENTMIHFGEVMILLPEP